MIICVLLAFDLGLSHALVVTERPMPARQRFARHRALHASGPARSGEEQDFAKLLWKSIKTRRDSSHSKPASANQGAPTAVTPAGGGESIEDAWAIYLREEKIMRTNPKNIVAIRHCEEALSAWLRLGNITLDVNSEEESPEFRAQWAEHAPRAVELYRTLMGPECSPDPEDLRAFLSNFRERLRQHIVRRPLDEFEPL